MDNPPEPQRTVRAAASAVVAVVAWFSAAASLLAVSTLVGLPPSIRFWGPVAASTVLSGAYWLILRGKAPLWAMLALPLAFSAPIVGSVGTTWRRRLEAHKAELKSQGFPASMADFAKSAPAGPVADPAAVAALSAHVTGLNKKAHPGLNPGPWSAAVLAEEAAFVKDAESPLLAKVAPVLADRPVSYSKPDWEEAARHPFTFPMPKFANLIASANTLRLAAGWHAYRGETGPALDRVRTLLDLADLVSSEPSLIGKAVALSIRQGAAKTACTVLFAPKSGALPADIARRLAAPDAPRWLAAGIRGERARALDAAAYLSGMHWGEFSEAGGFDMLISGGCLAGEDSSCGPRDLGFVKPTQFASMRLLQAFGFFALNALETSRALAPLATPGTAAELPARLQRQSDVMSAWTPWPHTLALISSPKFDSMEKRSFGSVGWDRLALTLSALKAHRAARGRLPDSLEELAPAYVPAEALQDPLTGKSFVYRRAAAHDVELCLTDVDTVEGPGPLCLKSPL